MKYKAIVKTRTTRQDLTKDLNRGQDIVDKFEVYVGPIQEVVPNIREYGRCFVDGTTILFNILDALKSKDEKRIFAWEHNFDLADACWAFEDSIKLMPDSPFLKGIVGIVKKDKKYIAIDWESIKPFIHPSGIRHFDISGSEIVYYRKIKIEKQFLRDEYYREGYVIKDHPEKEKDKPELINRKIVQNVVLFPYNEYNSSHLEFTPDQYGAIVSKEFKRDEVPKSFFRLEDIIDENGRISMPALAIYSSEIIIPLANEILENRIKRVAREYKKVIYKFGINHQYAAEFKGDTATLYYDYLKHIYFELPEIPFANVAEMRNLALKITNEGLEFSGRNGLHTSSGYVYMHDDNVLIGQKIVG